MRGLHKHIPTGKIVNLVNGEFEINGRISNNYSGYVFNDEGEMTNEYISAMVWDWEKINDKKIKITIENQEQIH